nr:uncharacterized protein LOC111514408 [Leptinotarsa decemlineata]
MDLPSDLSKDRVYSWVLQVLKKENVTNYQINLDGSSAKAEGFIGDIIFADVSGSDSNGQKKVLNLVIKIGKINVNLRDKFPMKNFSLREIFVYEQILPVFMEFQKEKNILNPFESFPRCYHTMVFPDTEVIILENCKPLGYEVNNSKSLNLEQIKLVLKSFAQFHALSFALRDQRKTVFEALTFKFPSIFGMILHDISFKSFYRRSIDEAIILLVNSDEIELAHKLQKIMEDDPVALMEDILQEDCNEESVILHGDNWINNFMFIQEETIISDPDVTTIWRNVKRTSERESAGLNQSLSSDYVWPNRFGSREKPESNLDKLPEKVVEDRSGESSSKIHEIHSKQPVHSRASRDTGSSRRSSLDLKKKRIALKIKRQIRELLRKSRELELEELQLEEKNRSELKKKEIADSLHLLQLEEELHEAEIDAQEEDSSQVQSEAGSENIRRELVQEQEQSNRVSQWIDYTSEQFHYDRQENLSRILEKTEKLTDNIPKVEGKFLEGKPENITSQDCKRPQNVFSPSFNNSKPNVT